MSIVSDKLGCAPAARWKLTSHFPTRPPRPQAPKTVSLFLIDCSASMGRERIFEFGDGDNKDTQVKTGLEVSKEYVKSKIVARVSGPDRSGVQGDSLAAS